MNLLLELSRLERRLSRSGLVRIAQELASPEGRAETERRVREMIDWPVTVAAIAESYEVLPVVRLPEFLPPHYPPPEPPESGPRLSRDYFGEKTRTRVKTCGICRVQGHDRRTCKAMDRDPLHLVGSARR